MGNVLAAARCFEKILIGKQVLKKESCFLDASIRNQLFFYFAWFKAYSYSTVAGAFGEHGVELVLVRHRSVISEHRTQRKSSKDSIVIYLLDSALRKME